ncbi:MAG: alkaline phosphatase family protein [Acidobacteria bacterium]|nr:alkaline phosphatase family protein [Acidobacteriota bacterium]
MMSLLAWLLMAALAGAAPERAQKPKLVVVIVADQFRYDYLTRFRADYKEGLHTLLEKGAVFTNAYFEHFPTVTAIGHSAILTGATPSVSGIIGNDWYDRETSTQVTSVSDPAVSNVGGSGGGGASPRRLLVSTVGDEMKIASGGRSCVIGVSLKDRAAILMAGHLADAAYWYEGSSGRFVTSTYYRSHLPDWVVQFNSTAAGQYKGAQWLGRKLPDDERAYSALVATPFGNDLLEAFAEAAVKNEELGSREATDLFAISFSSNDYVGHQYGPDAAEVRDISIETDQAIGKLFRFLDQQIGGRNILYVFTADHGVAPMPEGSAGRGIPGGRMPAGVIQTTVQAALAKRFGEGKWILSPSEHSLYLNRPLIREKKLSIAEVCGAAREAIEGIPRVFRVYTGEQLASRAMYEDLVGRRVLNGHHTSRGADIYILLEPYWMFGRSGTTHGTAYSYDAHVPIILMGPGIRPGRYDQTVTLNDLAPTLSSLLDVEPPSGSVGRVLTEALLSR